MSYKSHTPEEIIKAVTDDPTIRIFELDSGLAGEDDVLIGDDYNSVRIDLALFHGWDDDLENWKLTEKGWEAGGDGGPWIMDSETGLPKGWTLQEISKDEVIVHAAAATLGSLGGKVSTGGKSKSPAKQAAARKNGKKGGRPRKEVK